jgi:hypothetical protein
MAQPPKPRHRDGYTREETELVESACLTLAVTLGAFMDRLCIVGGLVPSLLIDHEVGPDPETGDGHPGTNDLDVALSVVLLDEGHYVEISRRLRREGFEPDENEAGNATPQRWKLADLNVTVDFLLPPIPGAEKGGRVHALEGDFGALIAPGLELVSEEREEVEVAGTTFKGERAMRKVPACGPGAFVVLKSLAFADRGEPKDVFDLVYVLRRWPAGIADIVERLAGHANEHRAVVGDALEKLASDFAAPDSIGPLRVVEFEGAVGDDDAVADAHGFVADLLDLCCARGLLPEA